MIRFMADTESGGPLLGLGLSDMNLIKLREGKPIDMDLRSMGIRLKICIFYGETEEKIAADLKDLIGPNMEIIGCQLPSAKADGLREREANPEPRE